MKLNMLLDSATSSGTTKNNNGASTWIMLVIIGLILVLLVVRMFADRKRQGKAEEMLNELKVGDKVVTNAGIYGEIVSIRQTNFGKVALIKSGEGKNVSYLEVNLSVILGIDEKQDVVLDSEGKIVEPKTEETKADDKNKTANEEPKKVEEPKAEPTEEVKAEDAKESKPKVRKPRAKKEAK